MGDGVHFDLALAVAGLLVGFTVGLTGMGGGALMTPILVLLFRVQPLAAVSSDLVASFIMKPVGGGVHLRRGTVNFALVKWLMVGSVPAAFAGVLVLRRLGDGAVVQARVKEALGIALVAAASSIAAKALLQYRAARRGRPGGRRRTGRRGPTGASRAAVPGAAAADGAGRGGRRAGGGHDLGGLRLADDRHADAALPDAELVRAGGHRPGAGDPAGGLGGARAPAIRRLQARPDRLPAGGLPARGLLRGQGLLPGQGRGHPPGAGGDPARLRAQAGRPRHAAARGGDGRGRAAGGAAVGRAGRHQPAPPRLARGQCEPAHGRRGAVGGGALRDRLRRRSGLLRLAPAEADRPAALPVAGGYTGPRLAVLFQQAACAATSEARGPAASFRQARSSNPVRRQPVRSTVDPDELGPAIERTARRLGRELKVPGFRKGKVPRQVLEARIGRETLIAEAIEHEAVPEFYAKAVKEH